MKSMKWIFLVLIGIVFTSFATLSFGEEVKRVWQMSSCFKFELGVRDKMLGGKFTAKFVVKSANGSTFVAEEKVDEGSKVVFPDDFHDERTKLKMGMVCHMSYKWYIYADNILVDKGTASFAREGVRK